MKLQFSLLSLLMIPTAFAAGWWLSEYKASERIAALEQEHAVRERDAAKVAETLTASAFINQAYESLKVAPEVLRRQKPAMLVATIHDLALTIQYGDAHLADSFLENAADALALLEVNDVDELVAVVKDADLLPETIKRSFLDAADREHDVIIHFVLRAFAWQRAQPTYPARLWLRAIGTDDAEMLRSAFSEALQEQVPSESWAERLEDYRAELQAHQADFEFSEFSFQYWTSNRDGEASILLKGQKCRTFKIIQEQDGWKLDELQGTLHLQQDSHTE